MSPLSILGTVLGFIMRIWSAFKRALFLRNVEEATTQIEKSESEEDDINGLKKLHDASYPDSQSPK